MATAAKIVAPAPITKDPSVCGGAACLDKTRTRVLDVVRAASEGHTPEGIRELLAVRLSLVHVHLRWRTLTNAEPRSRPSLRSRQVPDGVLALCRHQRMSDGDFVRQLQPLAAKRAAWVYSIVYLKPAA